MNNDLRQELFFSEQRVLSKLPGIIYWVDINGFFLGCNEKMAGILSLVSPSDIVGKTVYDFWADGIAKIIAEVDQAIMHNNTASSHEDRGPCSMGDDSCLFFEKVPLHDQQGQVIGLLATAIDITKHKLRELDLLYKKQHVEFSLQSIVKALPGTVYWKDVDGKYMGCNQNLVDIFGLESIEDVVGYTDFDVMPAKYARIVSDIDKQVIETGKDLNVEEKGFDNNKNPAIYLTKKQPIKDKFNNIIGVAGVSIDITQRKIDEEQLKKAKERAELSKKNAEFSLQSIIKVLPGTVYWKDAEGKYKGCNQNVIDILQLNSLADIIGKTDFDIMPLEYAKKVSIVDQEIMETGCSLGVEEVGFDKNNNRTTYYTNKMPLKDRDDKIIGLVGISIDITQRKIIEVELKKAKEKAELSDQMKSDFLMNMSHDLRSPCANILGLARRLAVDQDYSNNVFVQHIIETGSGLLNLLDSIIHSGELDCYQQLAVTSEVFDLNKLIAEVSEIVLAQALLKKINFQVINNLKDIQSICVDKCGVLRTLLNLLNNAVKFTEQGLVTLTVSSAPINEKRAKLIFMVQDTGIGMSEQSFNTIFDRFTRLSPSYQGRFDGVGLGLYVVKKIVDKLDGIITVTSKINLGSIFTVEIPVDRVNQPNKVEKSPRILSTRETYNKAIKILLVEDDRVAQTIEKDLLLENLGESVDVVTCGKDALDRTKKNRYSLIILDIGLPDMNGIELAALIRGQSIINYKAAIIGLTAHLNVDNKFKLQDTQLDLLFCKPLSRLNCQKISYYMSEVKNKVGDDI